MSWICPECGQENRDEFAICVCGHELDAAAATAGCQTIKQKASCILKNLCKTQCINADGSLSADEVLAVQRARLQKISLWSAIVSSILSNLFFPKGVIKVNYFLAPLFFGVGIYFVTIITQKHLRPKKYFAELLIFNTIFYFVFNIATLLVWAPFFIALMIGGGM